jgi:hypothetical protein
MTRAGLAILLFFFTLGIAHAAPPSAKRCIAIAERGQQLRKDGSLVDAQAAFRECSALECPAMVRRDCGKWVEELDESIPTVTVKLEDEDKKEIPSGRISVDGHPLPRSGEGRATPLDPGTHRFTWLRNPANVEEDVVIREGEKNRIIVLSAPRSPDPPPPPPPPAKDRTSLPWVIGGIGIVSAAVGGTLWGVGLSERASLENGCKLRGTCTQSDVDSSRVKLVVGDVFMGVGIVAVGVAIYFLVRGDSAPTAAGAAVAAAAGRATVLW